MTELTIAEQMTYTTTRISSFKGGAGVGSGTGFFFNFPMGEGKIIPAILTNKHVVEGCDQIAVSCHTRGEDGSPSGKFVPCLLDTGPGALILHPDDQVDLCAIPFGPILNQAVSNGTPLYYTGLDFSIIPKAEDWKYFDAIEEIVMVGCPRGIFDEYNNLPITRRGNTATALSKMYSGKNEFMIDMACFPGSSGSPIFVYDRDGYLDRKKNTHIIGASRVQFVGILYSGPLITNSGEVILNQPPKVEVAAMMHLGNAIRSTQIKGLHNEILSRFSDAKPTTEEVGEISFEPSEMPEL